MRRKARFPSLTAFSAAQRSAQMFYSISRTYIGGIISLMAIVMLCMFLLSYVIHARTSFGQKLKMVGSNYEAARFSGINCQKITMMAYMISSTFAAVGGIFYTALRKTASYAVFTTIIHYSFLSFKFSVILPPERQSIPERSFYP